MSEIPRYLALFDKMTMAQKVYSESSADDLLDRAEEIGLIGLVAIEPGFVLESKQDIEDYRAKRESIRKAHDMAIRALAEA